MRVVIAACIAVAAVATSAYSYPLSSPILFVARDQYLPDHHNTETMFQTAECNTASYRGGGALKVLDPRSGIVTTLFDPGPDGMVRDPEVSFDGTRIVFSMRRNIADTYHVYEVNADGTALRQLTAAPGVTDIDPLYLPDGGIVFTSTREPKYCMCNMHIMGNLFRMDGDGANIVQISRNTLHDGHAALMPDGRIIYDRWEYVDRNFGSAQGLWTVHPDGTSHAVYYGNNTMSPGAVIDPRCVPGTDRVACIFGSCHDRPWGAVALLDRRRGVDGRPAVVRTWPSNAIALVDQGDFDMFTQVHPKYEDPWPLNATHFLVSRATGQGEQMGIYLISTDATDELVHAEAKGCFDPMLLAPRHRPPVLPVMRDYQNAKGLFYVQDVYRGTHMAGVVRGTVKQLRVVESPEKRFWTPQAWNGQGVHKPAMNWHNFESKRILGTVPVSSDGSAYFEVPADTFVFFQLLDDKGMMIQSMRSATILQSGEQQGCVGCHESRLSTPAFNAAPPDALTSPPAMLDGWHGPPRMFSYMAEVQPVFDKHCVRCHDFGLPAGTNLVLALDRTLSFNASYIDLWSRGYISCVGAGPAEIQPAFSWGSHASRLSRVIQTNHHGVTLNAEETDRIITWMDINAPYYPTYASAYPDNPCGRSPLTMPQYDRLKQLTGAPFVLGHGPNQRAQISFERPERSLCLAMIGDTNSPTYREALAIIKTGSEQLRTVPRADMPGFVPCAADRAREQKYEERRATELRNRRAVRESREMFDEGLTPCTNSDMMVP